MEGEGGDPGSLMHVQRSDVKRLEDSCVLQSLDHGRPLSRTQAGAKYRSWDK